MTPPKTAILIATVGHTDIQWVDKDLVIHELAEKRELHDELLRRLADIEFVGLDGTSRAERDDKLNSWPVGPLRIVCPKIEPVLSELVEAIGTGGPTIEGAVILQTHQSTASPSGRREPVAAGPVVAKRVAEVLGLRWPDIPWSLEKPFVLGESRWVNILVDEESLNGPTIRDFPLSRVAAARIDSIVRLVGDASPSTLLQISHKGGPGPFKEVVDASGRLHFGWRCEPLDVPQRQRTAIRAGRSAAQALRCREQAVRLVRRGDFRGAAAVGVSLHDDELAFEPWVASLHRLANWLDGFEVAVPKELWSGKGPKALREAFRVESDLRSGRLPQALVGTGSLVDALFYLALKKWPNHEKACTVNTNAGILQPPNDTDRVAALVSEACLTQRGEWFKYDTDRHKMATWFSILEKIACRSLATTYAMKREAVNGRKSPRDLRNDVAHAQISGVWLRAATDIMAASGIWVKCDDGTLSALSAPVVVIALAELGIAGPLASYEGLISAVVRDISRCPLQ